MMICSVGYALNPKKLRKSGLDVDSVIVSSNAIQPEQSKVISSPSSGSNHMSSQRDTVTSIWRGGGLADIISDGLECEGVKFIPWNYEIPISLQV